MANLSFDDFLQDRKTQAAVVWQICVMGEAANRLDESIRQQATEVNWRKMVDMRNRLIHEHYRISYAVVWDVVSNELPPLITSVSRLRNGPSTGPR